MLKGLHIEGRRWFRNTYGNTYHSVRIYADGKLLACLPYQYGYGDGYLQTALDWLRENGHIPNVCQRCNVSKQDHKPNDESGHYFMAAYGTLYVRETLNGTYSVIDVPRQKDL